MRRAIVVSLWLGLLASAGTVSGAERSMSLEEAVRMAVERNEGLLIERESLAAAEASVSGANGAYDPLLELQGSLSRGNPPANTSFTGVSSAFAPETETSGGGAAIHQYLPTGGQLSLIGVGERATTDASYAMLSPVYSTRVGVELRQPLLRDLLIDEDRLAVRVAVAGRRGATASLRRATANTVAGVERAYWGLVAVRLAVGVLEETTRLAERQLEETRTRVESGTAPGTELAQPRAELERRRGDLLGAREIVARAENNLKLLILGDADDGLWVSTIVPSDTATAAGPALDVEAALRQALAQRPELEASQALVDRRRAESAFASNGVWPELDAVASYDRFGIAGTSNPLGPGGPLPAGVDGDLDDSFQSLEDGDYDAARIALVLSLPLPNRSARAAATIARSAERQAEAELTGVRKAIRAEVLDAAAALETARQRIEAARSGREAAEIQLSAEADRYATGLSTNFLVLTRQNDLAGARLDEISALTDYRRASTDMARATGSLLADRGIETPPPARQDERR